MKKFGSVEFYMFSYTSKSLYCKLWADLSSKQHDSVFGVAIERLWSLSRIGKSDCHQDLAIKFKRQHSEQV